jgi:hypothetical protein
MEKSRSFVRLPTSKLKRSQKHNSQSPPTHCCGKGGPFKGG